MHTGAGKQDTKPFLLAWFIAASTDATKELFVLSVWVDLMRDYIGNRLVHNSFMC